MMTSENPLLQPWTGPFETPAFDKIAPAQFSAAFTYALAAHDDDIAAIVADPHAPDFENTIAALERSGKALDRVASIFFNLASADTNDALQVVEREMAPILSRHHSEIYLNDPLFQRIETVARQGTSSLSPEQARVLERYHTSFVRNGAGLPPATKARLAEIAARLATLGTQFAQNVLADERSYQLVLEAPEDLAGLPQPLVAAAASAAQERGLPGKHVVTLARSSVEPFLQYSARRDLREQAFRAWALRGENGGATDNRAIAAEMVRLRSERASLLGYESFAHFRLADAMAKTPDAVRDLLHSVWTPARAHALREQDALQALSAAEGENHEIAPWDWRFYAEKRRKAAFDLDEAEIKPYFQLDKLIEAAFYTANRLFGVSFMERHDIPLYHPDARAWSVIGRDGSPIALFIGDYFARASKRSGAWMSAYRGQHTFDGVVRPIIVNVLNFAKPAAGAPCLLSFDDARTLFHEFGHALHGMLSNVTYPMISGTRVARDFVEFPSQIYEHWFESPDILRRFALHYETGAPMPEALLQRLLAARTFNQGFATVEYTASALIDLALHLAPQGADIDVLDFEKQELARLGMPSGIVMRHRTPHFTHVFSGDGYSAAYYSYLWSEILDADGFDAFEEAGDLFDPATAKKLHDYVYSAGYKLAPDEAYRAFRGRAPAPAALLRRRGLADKAA